MDSVWRFFCHRLFTAPRCISASMTSTSTPRNSTSHHTSSTWTKDVQSTKSFKLKPTMQTVRPNTVIFAVMTFSTRISLSPSTMKVRIKAQFLLIPTLITLFATTFTTASTFSNLIIDPIHQSTNPLFLSPALPALPLLQLYPLESNVCNRVFSFSEPKESPYNVTILDGKRV